MQLKCEGPYFSRSRAFFRGLFVRGGIDRGLIILTSPPDFCHTCVEGRRRCCVPELDVAAMEAGEDVQGAKAAKVEKGRRILER